MKLFQFYFTLDVKKYQSCMDLNFTNISTSNKYCHNFVALCIITNSKLV